VIAAAYKWSDADLAWRERNGVTDATVIGRKPDPRKPRSTWRHTKVDAPRG